MEDKFKELQDYIKLRIDIVSNDIDRWTGYNRRELPSFEFYLENKELLHKTRYKTSVQIIEPITYTHHMHRVTGSKRLIRYLEFSSWMGTPYNFKEVIKEYPIKTNKKT